MQLACVSRSAVRGRAAMAIIASTCPAVFERVFETSNVVTGRTPSRPTRRAAAFSVAPDPSGLITPMAVTMTRRGLYSDDSDIAFNTTEVRDGREDFRIDRGLRHVNPV
jgi:hypothetical protein